MDENQTFVMEDLEWIQLETPSPVSSDVLESSEVSLLQAPPQDFYLMTQATSETYGALEGASISDMFSIYFVGLLGGFAMALIVMYACWGCRVLYNLLRKGV